MFPRLNRDAPDRAFALEHYRQVAPAYDASCRLIEVKRARALELLELRSGETVVDVACGTGAMFEALARAVGPQGLVIGVEQSPEMLALARERVRRLAFHNILLIEASMEEASLPAEADAMLFSYTHDVVRSPKALTNLFSSARSGARVAACGAKLYPRWLVPLNLWVLWRTHGYLTTVNGLDRPWSLLSSYCPDFSVKETFFWGGGYVGNGTFTTV